VQIVQDEPRVLDLQEMRCHTPAESAFSLAPHDRGQVAGLECLVVPAPRSVAQLAAMESRVARSPDPDSKTKSGRALGLYREKPEDGVVAPRLSVRPPRRAWARLMRA
jgi:hypothetical protein